LFDLGEARCTGPGCGRRHPLWVSVLTSCRRCRPSGTLGQAAEEPSLLPVTHANVFLGYKSVTRAERGPNATQALDALVRLLRKMRGRRSIWCAFLALLVCPDLYPGRANNDNRTRSPVHMMNRRVGEIHLADKLARIHRRGKHTSSSLLA
jgi:hypothetical protein